MANFIRTLIKWPSSSSPPPSSTVSHSNSSPLKESEKPDHEPLPIFFTNVVENLQSFEQENSKSQPDLHIVQPKRRYLKGIRKIENMTFEHLDWIKEPKDLEAITNI